MATTAWVNEIDETRLADMAAITAWLEARS